MKSLIKDYSASAAVWVCYGITALSVIVRIIMYCKTRSLWLDEAMLAQSIVTRSFRSLFASPLANNQTAPALYLYAVKLFGAITGYSEGGLRVFSLFVFLGMLPVEYFLLTKVFKVGKVWTAFAVCVTSIFSMYMRYSNELKPYMGDAFFALAVLLLYHLYSTGKIKLPVLTVACCFILLFSTPAFFFTASVFICEFVFAIIVKDKSRIIKTVCAGVIVLIFFIVYYVLWLMPVAEGDVMRDFWKNNSFTVWPPTKQILKQDIKLIYGMLGKMGVLYSPFAVAGFIVSIIRKDKVSFVAGCSLLLVFAASSIEKWPVEPRLWMFVYALEIIYMAICFNCVKSIVFENGILPLKRVFVCIAVILVILNFTFIKQAGNGLYSETSEANPLIAYIQKNISADEYLYVYSPATCVVKYKNGWNTDRIGNAAKDNIIWGEDRTEWGNLNQNNAANEIDKILVAKKAYLLFYHTGPGGGIENGLKTLALLGYLHEVGEFHKTPLYYFTTDSDDPKRSETYDFDR